MIFMKTIVAAALGECVHLAGVEEMGGRLILGRV